MAPSAEPFGFANECRAISTIEDKDVLLEFGFGVRCGPELQTWETTG
jgi:hypothetical protein